MNITDPIADMLTRIRNASTSKFKTVDIPASNMKKSIAQILLDEGYIKAFEEIENETQGIIRITLKYDEKGKKVIAGLKRISKPGLRIYAAKDELPKVLNGLGIAIISTSQGLMTDREARAKGIGGEVLAVLAVYIVSWKFINSLFDSWEDLKNAGKRKKRRGRRTARIQNNR